MNYEDPSTISNLFNNYFTDVANTLFTSSSASSTLTIVPSFHSFLNNPMPNSFFCSKITISELISTVKLIKPSRTCIGNCISSTLLKDCISSIALPLLHIFNLSFDMGIFPSQLKLSRVTPVFKKGSKTTLSNYRPISSTNPLDFFLEKLMYSRMMSYINKFEILFDGQFGFRKNFSTAMAVLDVTNMIQNELYANNYVLGVFMDLQKAFDTLDFKILLSKLEHYGFRGLSYSWFKSYLEGRSQFTVINGHDSPLRLVTCGIPQGTVLGPLLFLLFINDIPNSVKDSSIKLFADDSNLFIVSNSLPALYSLANKEINSLSTWIDANKLYINYDKTNYMLFQPKKEIKKNPSIDKSFLLLIKGHIINRVSVVKYLGIFIDENLYWHEHIAYLCKKVSSLTGILYRVKLFLPTRCKKDIYFALIHSILIYCIEIYANVSKSILHPLIVKCNRLLRLMQSKSRRTPVPELYSTFSTIPVDKQFQFYTIKIIHKFIYDSSKLPTSIANLFTRCSSVHGHSTRNKDFIFIPSDSNPNSIKFYGPSMWSKLPISLQSDSNLYSFSRTFKQYLLHH